MKVLNKELKTLNHSSQITNIAGAILIKVMKFRRMVDSEEHKCPTDCNKCHAPHLNKVIRAVKSKQAISFVLPAFPGKSPNPSKVLGALPDMAEKQALKFLNNLCEEIKNIYPPGARVIICSDGRVFSDVVGITEEDITNYQAEIEHIIKESELMAISTFNLDDVFTGVSFDYAREILLGKYGQSLDELKNKVKRGGNNSDVPSDKEAHRMYCGLTRFLVEDSMHPSQVKSKTSIQKECKIKAYQAIIRSNAWTDLIAEEFPDAIRLSIHPQICGSKKIGIQLLGTETWMTPWHGVAVKSGNSYMLMKHKEAKKLNTVLVSDENGRPSHFELVE